MKRFFTMIVAVCAIFATSAQRPLVTLSHEGNLSFFSTLSAFEDAVESASDGDIIYLSEGQFTTMADTVTINKRLSIQGCGYKSRVMCHLLMDMRNVTADELDLPLFDGVRLRTLSFICDSLSRKNTKNATIRKCSIEDVVYCGYAAKNFLIDRCYISNRLDCDGAIASNITVQNSKIYSFKYEGHKYANSRYITVINCNIKLIDYLPKIIISSIVSNNTNYSAGGAAYNTLFLSYNIPSGIITDSCYHTNMYSSSDAFTILNETLLENNWLGQDGTVVGVYGGEFPFTENPSVPTVDSENSSVEYDADSNKLNVTITVLPN